MLNDLKLSERLGVAREWVAASARGELPAIEVHARVFLILLDECIEQAKELEPAEPSPDPSKVISLATGRAAEPGVITPSPIYLPEDFAGMNPMDVAGPIVVPFVRKATQ